MTAICTKCKTSATDFPPDKRKLNGQSSWCRSCVRAIKRARRSAYQTSTWYKQRRREACANHPRPSACEACGNAPGAKSLAWDHDHGTGLHRGWLCQLCNIALGCAGDNPALLHRLAAYLHEHGHTATRPVIR